MRYIRIVQCLLLVVVVGCASFDDFIETSLDREPSVIFNCDVYRSDRDSIVLIGIDDVSIPTKMMRSEGIQFYLKNTNNALTVFNFNSNLPSAHMRFSFVKREKLKGLITEYSQLSDMILFIILLKGMTVDEKKLSDIKTLESGDWRNISDLNAELVKQKKVVFVVKSIDAGGSEFFEKLRLNTFRL